MFLKKANRKNNEKFKRIYIRIEGHKSNVKWEQIFFSLSLAYNKENLYFVFQLGWLEVAAATRAM